MSWFRPSFQCYGCWVAHSFRPYESRVIVAPITVWLIFSKIYRHIVDLEISWEHPHLTLVVINICVCPLCCKCPWKVMAAIWMPTCRLCCTFVHQSYIHRTMNSSRSHKCSYPNALIKYNAYAMQFSFSCRPWYRIAIFNQLVGKSEWLQTLIQFGIPIFRICTAIEVLTCSLPWMQLIVNLLRSNSRVSHVWNKSISFYMITLYNKTNI